MLDLRVLFWVDLDAVFGPETVCATMLLLLLLQHVLECSDERAHVRTAPSRGSFVRQREQTFEGKSTAVAAASMSFKEVQARPLASICMRRAAYTVLI